MPKQNYISVLVEMLNAAKFKRDAKGAADAVENVGTQAKKAGDQSEKAAKKTNSSLASLAKWAASAYIFKKASSYLSGAVSETEDLAKSSLQLQRLTGLDIKTSSEWITVAQTRGIEASRLGVTFSQLGRTQQRALAGSKAQILAFRQVGVSINDLRRLNTTQLVEKISDAFAAMPDGLQKAALAQQFFGRTGRALLPLLNDGSASLQQNLGLVDKYGAALEGKTAGDVKKLIQRQRELNIAQVGFKEQLSDALIPTLTALSANLRVLLGVISPLLKNQTILRVVLLSLVGAWIAYTVAQGIATLATLAFRDVLATTGIGLLIIGLSLLIVKWDSVRPVLMRAMPALLAVKGVLMQIKDAAVTAWQWFASNWQTLAVIIGAPLLPAIASVVLLVKTIEWAIGKIEAAYGKISGVISKVANVTGKIAGIGGSVVGHIPGFATGGTMAYAGPALVGERGPELVHLPAGARVEPVNTGSYDAPAGGRRFEVVVPVTVMTADGKVLGRAVAKAAEDEGTWR